MADFRRDLIRKITDKTVAELAQEMGISPADLPKWSRVVDRTEKMAASFEKTLPAGRGREQEGEIEELMSPAGKQAVVVQILEKKETV